MKLPLKLKGFTLIELLMSTSIFILMTTILMANYPNSLVRSNLFNLSNNAVLLLREAQVKGSSIDSKGDTVTGYGIYFDKIDNKIIYFNDKGSIFTSSSLPGDKVYNENKGEAISTVNIVTGYSINKLFSYSGTATSSLDKLTVTFTRPSVRADFSPDNTLDGLVKEVCVELTTRKNPDLFRKIQVYSLGRIMSGPGQCPL